MAQQEMEQGALSRARVRWARALLWLAVMGVFPLALAQWEPWVIERQAIRSPGETTVTYVHQSLPGFWGLSNFLFAHGFGTPLLLVIGFLWFWLAFAPAGIVPALALVWGRGNTWAMRAYLAWLAAVTALAAAAASQAFSATPENFCSGSDCPTITIVSRQLGWGAWGTLGALVLLWVAAAARLRTPRAAFASSTASSTARLPQALRRSSAAAFTLGTLVWGVGLILVPWATNHCTGFPLAWTSFTSGVTGGTCAGLDANDAISHLWPATIAVGLESYFTMCLVFMGLLGIIAMGALWRKGWGGPVIATLWAALATWLFLQVSAGWADMLEHPPQLAGATPGAWVGGAGPWVTGVGLALAGIAVLAAWIAAWSAARSAAADSLRGRGRARDLAPVPDAPSAGSIY